MVRNNMSELPPIGNPSLASQSPRGYGKSSSNGSVTPRSARDPSPISYLGTPRVLTPRSQQKIMLAVPGLPTKLPIKIKTSERSEQISLDMKCIRDDTGKRTSPLASPKSMQSNNSVASSNSSTNGTPRLSNRVRNADKATPGRVLHKSNSWCAESRPSPNQKLETLFETKRNVTCQETTFTHEDPNEPPVISPGRVRHFSLTSIGKDGEGVKRAVTSKNKARPSDINKNKIRRNYSDQNLGDRKMSHSTDSVSPKAINEEKQINAEYTANVMDKKPPIPKRPSTSNGLNKKQLEKFHRETTKVSRQLSNDSQSDYIGSDDGEYDDRIITWLMGVDRGVETPPEIPIDYEEKQQTDTAIHVVYEEKT
ncbi:unnamed protein product [Owenia fusiformis]|uniref:Uncharacterized protein n=1 Tax=Owenia fusiformis TaxID=6347 RepID=A0A8J1UT46_OWEFU|nr:unnamed protein product [Owenia fusiformis]